MHDIISIGRKAASRYSFHRDLEDLVMIAATAAGRRLVENPEAPESHLVVAGRNAIVSHLRATECPGYMFKKLKEGFDPSAVSSGRPTRLRITVAENIDDAFDLADPGADPAEVSADEDLSGFIRTYVGGLQPADQPMLLAWADGESYTDIGRDLGISGEAVRQRVEKCLGLLRRRLMPIREQLW